MPRPAPAAPRNHPADLGPQNKNVVSVKGGCLDGLDWSKAVHIWTKSAMVPIPEGAESYPEEPGRAAAAAAACYSGPQEALDQPGLLSGSGGDPAREGRADQAQAQGPGGLPGPGALWTGNAAGG